MQIGFWIFMLIMLLPTPAIMIFFGQLFVRSTPQNINNWFGYRTKMSMKNQDTWQFAHRYFGKIWLRIGLILLPISIVLMSLFYGYDIDTVGTVGLAITAVQLIALIVPIIPTQKALHKTFDTNGNKK